MKQITIKGFAHCKPAQSYQHGDAHVIDGFSYHFCHVQLDGDGFIAVGEATLTFDLPEGFDPLAGAVETLKEQKQKLMAEFQARINQIDQQISQYTAIECEVQA